MCIFAVIFSISFVGCSSITEIDQRTIVHAVGIDKNEEGYEVSLQIFSPSGQGSDTPIDVSKSNTKVVSAVGETIYDGVKNCEYLLGGDIFLGHNKFIIFGSSLYQEDMWELLQWFYKENENYLGVTVGYAENSAKEVLDVKLDDGTSSVENMERIYEYAVSSAKTSGGDLLVLFNSLSQTQKSGLLPVFSVKDKKKSDEGEAEQGEEKEQYFEINSTAVLKNGKVVGEVFGEEMQGILWLTGKMDKCKATLEDGQEKFDVEIKKENTFCKVFFEGEKLVLCCDIKATVRVVEELDSDARKKVCALSQKKILESCEKAVEKTIDELGVDVLRIEKLVKFYQPSVFRQYADDFFKVISSIEIRSTAQCKIEN